VNDYTKYPELRVKLTNPDAIKYVLYLESISFVRNSVPTFAEIIYGEGVQKISW